MAAYFPRSICSTPVFSARSVISTLAASRTALASAKYFSRTRIERTWSLTCSNAGGGLGRLPSILMTCQPNCVSTGSLVYAPTFHANAACSNSGTICPGPNQPRSPPEVLPLGSLVFSLASFSKSAPPSSCLVMLSASSLVFTRMCRALTSLTGGVAAISWVEGADLLFGNLAGNFSVHQSRDQCAIAQEIEV